ncbi:hypothetical protein M413DRAFT_124453 [Hebeloma cylindrosporum]|uniref:Uncharacterized protein n=1 Tax=Hebeloma cylindrosporum TaxID=76867 RepID=A0A0C3CF60_HEBCY|nr:hypothetical protein M413DRAFT_124453 [Hebeloma cylindrosporum h7]
MNIITKLDLPSLRAEPIPFCDAYNANFSVADLPHFILFLECSFEESESEVVEYRPQSDGIFPSQSGAFSHRHSSTDISAVAEEVVRLLVKPDMDMPATPTRFVILGSPLALTEAVQERLTTTYSSIPVHVASPSDLSKGAAKFPLPDPDARRVRVTATYGLIIPISIETADGGAVVALPSGRKLRPAEGSVLLTTSFDNQISVTVRILLGNHAKAEDNFLGGTVVLEGLTPKAKGGWSSESRSSLAR